ncbi:UNVERIFIED_CONTAM: hypothetical protein GTU68_014424 [Idotea baltica]|nr:hypothetical protein [Idotea baltica]
MNAVYGASCMSKSRVYEWFQRFKDGRQSLGDDEHPGRPVSATDQSMVDHVEQLVLDDRRVTAGVRHHWHQCWLGSYDYSQETEDAEGLCSLDAKAASTGPEGTKTRGLSGASRPVPR